MTNANFIIRCAACGTKNRVPADKAGQMANCGKCRASFDTSDLLVKGPVILTSNNFDDYVTKSQLPVLVDFWAPWCGPCKMVSPIVEKASVVYKGRLKVGKLNIDQAPDIAVRYNVMSVPTLMVFDQGQVKQSLYGAVPESQIMQLIEQHIY